MTNLYKQVFDFDNMSMPRRSSVSHDSASLRSYDSMSSLCSVQFYPAIHWELCNIRWFHPHLNRNLSEHILIGTNKVGSYLLRNYSKGGPDDLAVSVRFPDDVKHFTVLWQGDGYLFGQHKFDNLKKLLEHFENIPMLGTSDGTQHEGKVSVALRYPYPREFDDDGGAFYGSIVEQVEAGARPADIHTCDGDIADPEFEIRQKTGYLTKRGDRVKNWKCRWFVLQKHWLRYYAQKEATHPRGVVDLSKATECKEDNSYANGFTLTVPKRVYYLQASNEEERTSWMDMLSWKLDYYNPNRHRIGSTSSLY